MDTACLFPAFGIVRRLRFVFLAIACVVGISTFTAVKNLMKLDGAADTLTHVSVPVFVQAGEIERTLKELILLLQEVDRVEELSDLSPMKASVTAKLDNLRAATRDFDGRGLTRKMATELDQALNDFEWDASRILTSRAQFLESRTTLNRQIDDLAKTRIKIRDLLEALAIQVAADVEAPAVPDGVDRSVVDLRRNFFENLSRANAITQLTLEIDAIISTATVLRDITSDDAKRQAEQTLRFKFRGVAVLISRLSDSDLRVALAREVNHLREAVYASDGILSLIRQLRSYALVLQSLKVGQYAPIDSISRLSDQLTSSARNKVGTASTELDETTDRLMLIMISVCAVSIVSIICAVWFVVEKQINRRMARLTHAVLAIAGGQTDYRVDVTGPDELGKMARALEVFKTNAQELERSNSELEKFAYVAAHDLRSPLRGIKDLTDWTLEDPDTVLSADGQSYMDLVQSRIQRLNDLLSDLLEYSRIGKEEQNIGKISIGDIVSDLADLLDPADAYQIRYSGTTDQVVTHITPLHHILLNLISNAIKHHDQPTGHVNVNASIEDGLISISVQDDGAGIPPDYHDRIFGLFQTLQSRDVVEGSGLGLAIIRKSLEHLGGSISVRSDPEKERGTTFTFHLRNLSDASTPLARAA